MTDGLSFRTGCRAQRGWLMKTSRLLFIIAIASIALIGLTVGRLAFHHDHRATSSGVTDAEEARADREKISPWQMPLIGALQPGVFAPVSARSWTAPGASDRLAKARILENYGSLPLRFELTQGQTDRQVRFLSRGSGYTVFLTRREAVMAFNGPSGEVGAVQTQPRRPIVLRMVLDGADPEPQMAGLGRLESQTNYFHGNDPTKWHAAVPTFEKVVYRNVYPGVDLVYFGRQRELEYDLVLSPGADPRAITLDFHGAEQVEIDARGDLVLHTAAGDVRQRSPVVYQETGSGKEIVPARYAMKGPHRVGFDVAAYDRSNTLVIDPVLSYSTYLGGSGDDFGAGIAVDVDGNAYVTGWTDSLDFPTTSGSIQNARRASTDAFVTKINRDGNAVVYSTFLGGDGKEFEVIGIDVDPAGSAYVTGITESANFPTTIGSVQPNFHGVLDVFVTKIDPSGSQLVFSTYLGGAAIDGSQALVVDPFSGIYVTGFTQSTDFPVTAGVFQAAPGGGQDAFIARLTPDGSGLVYSTYLGGHNTEFTTGIARDSGHNAYVTGFTQSYDFPTTPGAIQTQPHGGDEAFVAKVDPSGSSLVYSTYLGGGGDDVGRDIVLDATGNAYLAGITESADFPITPGVFQEVFGGFSDVFISKVNPSGSAIVYSTYLGGGGPEISRRLALDLAGNMYVTGATNSPNFPTTPDAVQTVHAGGEDVFFSKMRSDGKALLYSTLLGGSGNDRARGMAVDTEGDAYLTGFTSSTDFPTMSPIQAAFAGGPGHCFFSGGCDGFVTKISQVTPVDITVSSSTTVVRRGDTLSVAASIRNVTGQPQPVAFVVTLTPPLGPEFLLVSPVPMLLAPDAGGTVPLALPLPQDIPVGPWVLKGIIVRQRDADGVEIVDIGSLVFTVI
jgi:hypothetical protein